jgi:polysaccharide export outer membrane protein
MAFETKAPRLRPRLTVARLLAVALLATAVGCVQPPAPAQLASSAQQPISDAELETFNQDIALMAAQAASVPSEYLVGPEDLIEVTLYDIANTDGEPRMVMARVSNSGFITLPYIGKVQAAGFSPLDLEEELRKAYLEFIHDPQITIFVREYRSFRVSVVGNVKQPGVLELRGRKTLLEALALAGGLNDEAGRSIRLSRSGDEGVQSVVINLDQLAQSGDLRLNPSLLPGDVINVPRAGTFYVEGMVKKPGAYPLLSDTSVSQALATAGGVEETLARSSGTVIYRKGEDGQWSEIPIDLAAIGKGKVPDVPVQPDDVVVVPVSGPKFAVERVLGLVRVGVNTAVPF